jgi:DNA-binding GntR family transcriptional regulator
MPTVSLTASYQVNTANLSTPPSLKDAAYEGMRRRILDNVWIPGYRALEQEIALELGVSRTPVREALIRLEREGLVQVIPRHGMRVLPMSATDMREIYEVLTALESLAVELVATRRPSEAELQPLVKSTTAMEQALIENDLDAWALADESFHERLVTMSGNRHLIEAVFTHWDRAHRARMFTLRLRPKPVNSTHEHTALVERLQAGDSVGASAANRAHRQRASRELLAIFERYRLQQM